jgi:hypothetical protein
VKCAYNFIILCDKEYAKNNNYVSKRCDKECAKNNNFVMFAKNNKK